MEVKKSTMVYPAEETPKKSIWLSSLDLVTSHSPTPGLFIYSPNNTTQTNPKNPSKFFNAEILKQSLSKALVTFYTMAGRLKKNPKTGRLEIDCNAEGALFVEAESTRSLADFGEYFTPNDELRKVVIPTWPPADHRDGAAVVAVPLLMVQLTRFKCGGVSLGTAMNHQHGDGAADLHFLNAWAKLARGDESLDVLRSYDRVPYLLPHNPPQVKFNHLEFDPPQGLLAGDPQLGKLIETNSMAVQVFRLSKDQISALKLKAASEDTSQKLNTFEVLAGHVWRSACRARGLNHDQEVRLYTLADGRSRLKDPALPRGFNGNAIFITTSVARAGEVACNTLLYAASKVKEAVRRINDEDYLRSAIDYLESQPDLTTLARGAHTYRCPNLIINSWARISFYEVDFGWGEPLYAGHGGMGYEGSTIITQSPNRDGSLLVAISLFQDHMSLFEKYVYDFIN